MRNKQKFRKKYQEFALVLFGIMWYNVIWIIIIMEVDFKPQQLSYTERTPFYL